MGVESVRDAKKRSRGTRSQTNWSRIKPTNSCPLISYLAYIYISLELRDKHPDFLRNVYVDHAV